MMRHRFPFPRRRLRAMVAAVVLGMLAGRGSWTSPGAEFHEDARSSRLMAAIETAQRAGDRLFAMDLELTVDRRFKSHNRILAVSHHDPAATRLLYVVTAPRNLRGTTLLIADSTRAARADRMWFALPGRRPLYEVRSTSLRLLVPGTGMTFEESRGWIAGEKYRFGPGQRTGNGVAFEARPRSDSLGAILGVSRLVLQVDPARRVVVAVSTYDEAGNLARTYRAVRFERVAGRWHPARVELAEISQRLEVVVSFRYAALDRPPAADCFSADSSAARGLDRLAALRERAGLASSFPDTLR